MLFNSVISTKDAQFMTMDISNFYLMTPLHHDKFIQIKLSGSIYIRPKRSMYGLPQAGLLANKLLKKCLSKHRYRQSKLVHGLRKHDTRPIQFTLVVNNFGIKYVGEEYAQHLKNALKEHYKLTCNWTGKQNIGITLDWVYNKRHVHLFMPNYVQKTLKQFQHKAVKQQHVPYQSTPIQNGANEQYATQELETPLLDNKAKWFIQQVCGKFLFFSRAVDSTLLCPISAIASQSSKPTEDTMQQTLQLLDYLATQEGAVLSYHVSNMVLAVHSNASYLSKSKAQSQVGGHFFLSSDTTVPPNNGEILNIAHIIKNVMSSATEAELAGLYIMAHKVVFIRIILEELGLIHLPHHYKLIMQWRTASSMAKNKKKPKPWT
jgi:hypothetical protein